MTDLTTIDETAREPRIVIETGLEARIAAIVEPVAEQVGFRLVRVKLSQQNGMTLQVMAERPDGTMSVDDCEELSRALSPVLDVEDPIDREYHLEVSSPGIDRPLVRRSDFEAWRGHLMKLEANRMVGGRKRWRGRVSAVTDSGIRIERDQPPPDEDASAEIPFDAVGDARLVLTDELIEATLKADKQARRGLFAGGADNDNDEEAFG
ncbi:ribosome maturation factor RimP [Aureimonas leprariae]|uniref:Ribosome maturation factor RimP n=1 Tax=Plantimonas leprariae TaxID=2615207 RepID=A0A7V7TYC5_9HYPH|nr:ribosome maturation factor RimP [Aureimonas leprariae]KAB0682847.1 ribosome maturation factor RimP [Aureimonas leprariae]